MTKHRQVAGQEEVYLPSIIGGTAVAPSGGTASVVPPVGTRSIFMIAEGGAAYYNTLAAAAGTASPGFIPQNVNSVIFDCDNFQAGSGTLSISAGSAITVHLQYYS